MARNSARWSASSPGGAASAAGAAVSPWVNACGERLGAVLAKQFLHPTDGIAFGVQQVPDAAQQPNVLGPVVAAPATPLQGPDMGEFGLPETQHVLRQIELGRDFADGSEGRGGISRRDYPDSPRICAAELAPLSNRRLRPHLFR